MAFDANESAWMETLILAFQRDNTRLNDRSIAFFKDQIERWNLYGDQTRFSPKQLDWMDSIAERLGVPKRDEVTAPRVTDQDELGDEISF